MREGIGVEVSAAERVRLEAFVADRNSRHKHVWRARIVRLTADGWGPRRSWPWRAVQAGGGRGSVARQDATRAHPTAAIERAGAQGGLDLRRPAGRGDALDGPDDGESGRHQLYWFRLNQTDIGGFQKRGTGGRGAVLTP